MLLYVDRKILVQTFVQDEVRVTMERAPFNTELPGTGFSLLSQDLAQLNRQPGPQSEMSLASTLIARRPHAREGVGD